MNTNFENPAFQTEMVGKELFDMIQISLDELILKLKTSGLRDVGGTIKTLQQVKRENEKIWDRFVYFLNQPPPGAD